MIGLQNMEKKEKNIQVKESCVLTNVTQSYLPYSTVIYSTCQGRSLRMKLVFLIDYQAASKICLTSPSVYCRTKRVNKTAFKKK